MKRKTFTTSSEPRGHAYHQLLRLLNQAAEEVLVVVQDNHGLSPQAEVFLRSLTAMGGMSTRSSSWPGTQLLDQVATVFRCKCSPGVLDLLTSVSESLFSWQQPGLPEDIAFLRSDGTTILGTVAHESDAWLDLDDHEREVFELATGLSLISDDPADV